MPKTAQTKDNHARLDPGFHFTLVPLILIPLVWSGIDVVRRHDSVAVIEFLIALLLLWTATKSRMYSLQVQDRLIRLEERLRLQTVLPESMRGRIAELSEKQLIALRFAGDAELPALVARTLQEHLAPKQIKESIQIWRPDYFRV